MKNLSLRVKATSLLPLFLPQLMNNHQIKPHQEYSKLVDLLLSRGMIISDSERQYAERKLLQVGYYRLSGFWFSSRQTKIIDNNSNNKNEFIDLFLPETKFVNIYRLYLFDKKIRLLLLDIIERLEVNIRSVLAHEMGRIEPLAYKDVRFINPRWESDYTGKWLPKLTESIKNSKDDFIKWHTNQNKPIPFWVVIEVWDFGTLSKYYSFLKGSYQTRIAKKFDIDANTFGKWLHEINLLRNLCAHHSRVWNREYSSEIRTPTIQNLNVADKGKKRLFSRIIVLWYLNSKAGSKNYKWLEKLISLINEDFPAVPNAKLESMGITGDPIQQIELLRNTCKE
ncbi:Abi family protein [Testudinibacter sp. P27/CKL/0425]